MSIHATIYVKKDMPPEAIGTAVGVLRAKPLDYIDGEPLVIYRDVIDLNVLEHYYSEHYPQGWWPRLREAILAMREAFPGVPVFYCGDTCPAELAEEATPERIERLTQHWDARPDA